MSSISSTTRSQPFGCNICHKRFTRHENLKRHASVHERARGTKLLTCNKCQVTFSRSDLQHRHMKRKHPEALITRHDSITSQEEAWPVSDSPQNSAVSSPAEQFTSALLLSRGTTFTATPCEETSNIHGSMIPRQTAEIPYSNIGWQTPPAEGSEHSLTEESYSDAWPPYQTHDARDYDHGQQSLNEIEHGLQLYFSCFAPSLPFIHQASFDTETATECLLLAMLAIGLHHDDRLEHIDEARHFYGRALMLLDRINDEELKTTADALTIVQTLLLLEVYAILYICGQSSATGLRLHTRMIALSRSARLLQGAHQQEPIGQDLDAVWQDFVFAESHKRTMLAVHQVDALWYHFLSIPRSLSHLEIKHKLPCSATDWTAPTAAEWAYSRLTKSCADSTSSKSTPTSTLYPDMIRHLLNPATSSTKDHADLTTSDSFGLTNFAHFALSSIREISGWSTITGCVSMDRVEPLKAALMSVAPVSSHPNGGSSDTPTSIAFRATWEMAVIDLHIWSLSHTGGVVHSSMDAALEHSTQLAIDGDLVLNAEIVATIRPHVDWFLRYLDNGAMSADSSDPPWVVLFAYKVFLLVWQCLRQGLTDVMDVVMGRRCHDESCGAATLATRWARAVMERRGRHKWRYVEVIMKCLDALEAVS